MLNMRALIDANNYFDRVEAYYRMFSNDLCYYGDNIVIEPRKINRIAYRSISDLLAALIRFGRAGEKMFLIGSHGNPHGLPIRIVANNGATLNADIMDNLSDALDGSASGRQSAMGYGDGSGRRVFANERELDALLDQFRQVRRLELEHLEFRGCNLGAGPALASLHRLLGSRLTAAPKVRFVWSRINTHGMHMPADRLRERIDRLPPDRRLFNRVDCMRASSGSNQTEIVVAMAISGYDSEGRPSNLQMYALNTDMIKGFTQGYLQPIVNYAMGAEPPGGGYRPGGQMPIIGFHTPQGSKPFVIPGDGFEYTEQIAYEMAPPTAASLAALFGGRP